MTDYSELKRLAEAAISPDSLEPVVVFRHYATPSVILALIAEPSRLGGECEGCPMAIAETLRIERDQLKAENEALRGAMLAVSIVIDGDIRATVRDCVNGLPDVQDIYGYCDNMDAIILAAMSQGEQA